MAGSLCKTQPDFARAVSHEIDTFLGNDDAGNLLDYQMPELNYKVGIIVPMSLFSAMRKGIGAVARELLFFLPAEDDHPDKKHGTEKDIELFYNLETATSRRQPIPGCFRPVGRIRHR